MPAVETKYRRIHTAIPVPESIDSRAAPSTTVDERPAVGGLGSGRGLPGFRPLGQPVARLVERRAGRNAVHNHPKVAGACSNRSMRAGPTTTFPSSERPAWRQQRVAPEARQGVPADHGSEATECVKLARTEGAGSASGKKIGIVTFDNAFRPHDGAQMAGGIPA